MQNILMFSIATQGYHWCYKNNISSHKAYAQRYGMSYQLVTRPRFSKLGQEIVWLKLTLMLAALEAGYDWVFFLDADTKVQETAPNIINQKQEGKDFYLAKGYSNRLNSGVILVRNTFQSRKKISQIINNIDTLLPKEDDVGWGENGHVIHYLKKEDSLKILSQRWNNNHDPELHDFIRHYSAGPLRILYTVPWHHKVMFILNQSVSKLIRKKNLLWHSDHESKAKQLTDLTEQCLSVYSIFSTINELSSRFRLISGYVKHFRYL